MPMSRRRPFKGRLKGRRQFLLVGLLLLLLALAAVAVVVLAAASVINAAGSLMPLWYVLAVAGALGAVGVAASRPAG